MEKESTSFWSDIKKYEDMLEKDPLSYCFAPLAELYRKIGLLDDAINVAQKGCEIHPDYVGGHMALGRAFYEKGLKEEGRMALERVVTSTPDNLLAQKLLSKIYVEIGDTVSAEKSLKTILSSNPDDPESRVLLKSIERGGMEASITSGRESVDLEDSFQAAVGDLYTEAVSDDELLLEELEIIEELTEEVEDFQVDHPDEGLSGKGAGYGGVFDGDGRKDPLQTATLAELYVSQGLLKSALDVYDGLQKADPENLAYARRYDELSRAVAAEGGNTGIQQESSHGTVPTVTDVSPLELAGSDLSSTDDDMAVVETLEQWLENIRRRR